MAAPQIVSLQPFFNLRDGYTIRITALDPGGAGLVSGVVISNATLSVDYPAGAASELPPPSPVTGAYTSGGVEG